MNVVVTGEEFNETLSFFASITHPKKKFERIDNIVGISFFSFSINTFFHKIIKNT